MPAPEATSEEDYQSRARFERERVQREPRMGMEWDVDLTTAASLVTRCVPLATSFVGLYNKSYERNYSRAKRWM